jgi:hypothetical protein
MYPYEKLADLCFKLDRDVAIAILNGVIREKAYGQFMGELPAHQLSTFIGIVLFGIYIWILTGTCPIKSSTQALIIGGMWLCMTVIFEFVFGHYVAGHPWNKLFHDYNLFKGAGVVVGVDLDCCRPVFILSDSFLTNCRRIIEWHTNSIPRNW